jgi:hypothetical protein
MRLILLLAATFVFVACSPSAPAPATKTTSASVATSTTTAATDAPAEFQLASGNIGCDYVPAGGTETYTTPDGGPQLICDRIEPTYVRFALSAHGAATRYDHVGDAGCCGGYTMAAGAHWAEGPFACDLAQAGITCTNADRHGFTLSRSTARVN